MNNSNYTSKREGKMNNAENLTIRQNNHEYLYD